MVNGKWTTQWYQPDDEGRFVRPETQFREQIAADGAHPPAAGRYHLYVSYACPWAHRTLIMRALHRLEDAIEVSVVHPFMGDDGWTFASDFDGATGDRVANRRFLREVYAAARSDYTGRVTVPVLWDRQRETIVCNESRELIQMLDGPLASLGDSTRRLLPEDRAEEILEMIDANYEPVNNGVYRAGFATKQGAYEEAVSALFRRLDLLEELLGKQRFLCGDELTAADICLFTTLVRFDNVYYTHFKCNVRRIVDYPHLWGFVRDVYQTDEIAQTCRFDHIKHHYFASHETINPHRIVPMGPIIDFTAPHQRSSPPTRSPETSDS